MKNVSFKNKKNKKQNNKKKHFRARVKSRGGDPNGKKTFYSVTNSEGNNGSITVEAVDGNDIANERVDELKNELNSCNEKHDNLQYRFNVLKSEIELSKEQSKKITDNSESLTYEMKKLTEELKFQEDIINKKEDIINEKKDIINELNNKLKTYSIELNKQNEKLEELRLLKRQLKTYNNEVTKLKQEQAKANEKLKQAQAQVNQAEAQAEELKKAREAEAAPHSGSTSYKQNAENLLKTVIKRKEKIDEGLQKTLERFKNPKERFFASVSDKLKNLNTLDKRLQQVQAGGNNTQPIPTLKNIYKKLYNTLIYCYIKYNKIIYTKEFKFIEYIINKQDDTKKLISKKEEITYFNKFININYGKGNEIKIKEVFKIFFMFLSDLEDLIENPTNINGKKTQYKNININDETQESNYQYTYLEQFIEVMIDILVQIDNIIHNENVKNQIKTIYDNIKDIADLNEKLKEFNNDVITYVKIRDNQIIKGTQNQDINICYFNPNFLFYSNTDYQESVKDVKIHENSPLSLFYTNDTVNEISSSNNTIKVSSGKPVKLFGHKQITISKKQTYNHLFNYGNFSKIFYNTFNEQFGQNMTEVENSLKKGDNVFLIGYGASGAGKTTTLIYDSFNKNNGSVCFLLNQMATEKAKIELSIVELYPELDNKKQMEEIEMEKLKNLSFKFYDNDFISEKDFQKPANVPDELFGTEQIDVNTSLSSVLKRLIDEKRKVKATSNNPQSSRSHVLAFIKLNFINNNGKSPTLIIGDFAGVENKFDYNIDVKNLENVFNQLMNKTKSSHIMNVLPRGENIFELPDDDIENDGTKLINFIQQNAKNLGLNSNIVSMNNKKVVGEEEKYVYDPNINNLEELKTEALNKLTIKEEQTYINKLFELYGKYTSKTANSSDDELSRIIVDVKQKLQINNLINDELSKDIVFFLNKIQDVPKYKISFGTVFGNVAKITKIIIKDNDLTLNHDLYEKNINDNSQNYITNLKYTIKKGVKNEEVKFDNTSSANIIKKLIEKIIKEKINDKIHEIVTPIRDKLKANNKQQQSNKELADKHKKISIILKRIIQLVCELINRSFEGDFINSSLKDMREKMTQNLINKNNGNELYPNLNEDCAEYYCDDIMGDCFDVLKSSKETINCKIHDIITDNFKIDINTLKYCVCLVINNTLLDENQKIIEPRIKIPYIDLSLLKKELKRIQRIIRQKKNTHYYKSLIFRKKISNREEEDIMYNSVKELFKKNYSNAELDDYRSTGSFDYNLLEKIHKYVNTHYTKAIKKGNISITELEKLNNLYNEINSQNPNSQNHNSQNSNRQNPKSQQSDINISEIYKLLKPYIKNIETLNAISVVGTLDFTDEMSKYNLSYHKCSYNNNDINKNINILFKNIGKNEPNKIIFARQFTGDVVENSIRYKFLLNQVLEDKTTLVKYTNPYDNPVSGGKNNRTNKRKTKRSKLKKISGIKKFRKTYKLKVKKLKY